MLNVDHFYSRFGALVAPDEYIELSGKQVLARPDRIFILRLGDEDPFTWLSQPHDGLVFKTVSGYLALVAFFDSDYDETEKAFILCQRMVGVVQ